MKFINRNSLFFGFFVAIMLLIGHFIKHSVTSKIIIIDLSLGFLGTVIVGFIEIYRQKKLRLFIDSINLDKDELKIFSDDSSHLYSFRSIKGVLILTNKRLIYKSNYKSMNSKKADYEIAIKLNDITDLKSTYVINDLTYCIVLKDKDFNSYKFAISKPHKWIDEIEINKKNTPHNTRYSQ